jgi:hypothetical protein
MSKEGSDNRGEKDLSSSPLVMAKEIRQVLTPREKSTSKPSQRKSTEFGYKEKKIKLSRGSSFSSTGTDETTSNFSDVRPNIEKLSEEKGRANSLKSISAFNSSLQITHTIILTHLEFFHFLFLYFLILCFNLLFFSEQSFLYFHSRLI